MSYYQSIKDCVLYSYLSNKVITLDDFITCLEILLDDVELFEHTVNKILHQNPKNKKIADEIMSITSTDLIRCYINIIKYQA